MLKVHLKNGETLRFDLSCEQDAKRWLDHASSRSFQHSITALTLQQNGVSFSLPRPLGFEQVFMLAEHVPPAGRIKGGEKLVCRADEVGISLMAHKNQKALRIDVSRQGWQRLSKLKDL